MANTLLIIQTTAIAIFIGAMFFGTCPGLGCNLETSRALGEHTWAKN